MRFMMIVKGGSDYEAGKPPNPELMAAVARAAEEQAKAGILLESGGLLPSAAGAKVRVKGGKLTVIDGPFSEAKELIGGFAILKASSKADAIEMGRSFMELHARILGSSYEGELEIRQMMDAPPHDGGGR
jgi:hypothetical protein